jgi:hypothetical protein
MLLGTTPSRLGSLHMNVPRLATLLLAAALTFGSGQAFSQQQENKDHVAVLELGAAGAWGIGDGTASFGPSVAVEVTPIEHWLEIEAGVTPLMRKGNTEWDFDLVFKKPFQLSKNVEFMFGVGPEWDPPTHSIGTVAVADFMFWITPQYGWFLEPSYSYSFNREHDKSLAVNVGLMIALPSH